MRKIITVLIISLVFVSCENTQKSTDEIYKETVEETSIDQEGQTNEVTNKTEKVKKIETTKDTQVIKKTEIVEKSQWERLLNKNIKAPDLIGLTNWINWEEIKSLEELKWKVVFIDFWTYTCINCIRTLDHMQELHEKYGPEWLVILWIHAPEFAYERKIENVKKAVKKYWLTYRIVQDNDFKTWKNYKNRYWPAQYIINKKWNLKYVHYWEWAYEKMEKVVEFLLSE